MLLKTSVQADANKKEVFSWESFSNSPERTLRRISETSQKESPLSLKNSCFKTFQDASPVNHLKTLDWT